MYEWAASHQDLSFLRVSASKPRCTTPQTESYIEVCLAVAGRERSLSYTDDIYFWHKVRAVAGRERSLSYTPRGHRGKAHAAVAGRERPSSYTFLLYTTEVADTKRSLEVG